MKDMETTNQDRDYDISVKPPIILNECIAQGNNTERIITLSRIWPKSATYWSVCDVDGIFFFHHR